jgi:Fe-S-cluster-containing hydrogenase component 2
MSPKVASLSEEFFLLDCVGSCPKDAFRIYDGQSQLARSLICDLCKSSAQGKMPAIGGSCSAM